MQVMIFSRYDNVSAITDDNIILSENKNDLLGVILDHMRSHKQHL